MVDLATLYGEITDYTSIDNIQWQLFYDDKDWIYLIASDYVSGDTLPNELLTDEQYTTFCRVFAKETNSTYTGIIMENEPWSNGTNSNTIINNPQTNTYLKWVNSSVATTKNNPNIKAVAYMMDTSKWKNFAGDVENAYAIGGPTIEMFVKSYNVKHNTNQLGEYEVIDKNNSSSNGYKVKTGENKWANEVWISDKSESMWIKTSKDKAYGYWIASPSSGWNYYVLYVNFGGRLSYNRPSVVAGTSQLGFRPLVAIPKSSLK